MKDIDRTWIIAAALAGLTIGTATAVSGAELIKAKDGSGHYGYKDTPVLPWCGFHVHDPDRPAPKRVEPAYKGNESVCLPPSDAIVLFNGSDLSQWEASDWKVVDGCIEAGNGNFSTRESFGDFQLHLEWKAPHPWTGPWYNRGNNGVFIMGLYEIQVFDSWSEKIYPDGMAGAIYGQTPPLVNPIRPPGEWQSYDILFKAPRFEGNKLVQPARITLFFNGVMVHWNEEIHGETNHRILPAYNQKVSQGPLKLGGHDCPVRFRNIWIRRL